MTAFTLRIRNHLPYWDVTDSFCSHNLKNSLFCDTMPCSPLKLSWYFVGKCHIHLLGQRIRPAKSRQQADISSKTLYDFQRTTGHYIPEYRTLHNHCCFLMCTWFIMLTRSILVPIYYTVAALFLPFIKLLPDSNRFDLDLINNHVSIGIPMLDSFNLLVHNHYFLPNTNRKTITSILIPWRWT
jgi:hypothetical protein